MYRPGGFPEYSLKEQKIFDGMMNILTKHFQQWNYQHIMTPAVESVDILSRGGDIFDKQVYGLYGLAQATIGKEDYKNYALHFDLTIPFARYTLDHLGELTFPFKRYQMQPVWRGERTKRGRYKEFWQFDIDTIWRSGTDVGFWCDAESIIVMYKALQEIFTWAQVDKKVIVRVSNVQMAKNMLESWKIDEDRLQGVWRTLDNWYKNTKEDNVKELNAFLEKEHAETILSIIEEKNIEAMTKYEGSEHLASVLGALKQFDVRHEFALPIVRGHAYYTGTVVEFFLEEDIELGALAGGGAYNNLTDFIDPKNSFSGVGCSLSSRVMEILIHHGKFVRLENEQKTALVIHFSDMFADGCSLLAKLQAAGYSADIYPTAEKFGKQIQHADKRGINYVVSYGDNERDNNIFKMKNLKTGDEKTYTMVDCYGAILFCDHKVLLVKNHGGGWGFPKGKPEKNESIEESILRELEEETGIKKVKSLSNSIYQTSYFYDNGELIFKTIQYKVFETSSDKVSLQKEELAEYRWATREEALKILPQDMHHLIDPVNNYFL